MRRVPLLLLVLAAVLGCFAPAAAGASPKPLQPGSRARAESALDRVEQLRQGQGVRSGRELTPALAALAKRKNSLSSSDRERARSILARPTDGASDPFGDGYTVAEHAPLCTTHFCIHFVTSTADAPSLTDSDSDGFPNYVETMAAQFEFVYSVENGTAPGDLAWTTPKPDGTLGGNSKTDVYGTNDWIWTKDAQPFQGVSVTGPTAGPAPAPAQPAAPVVPPANATPKLTSTFSLRSRQGLKTILSRGVLVRVRCNQACRVRVELRLPRSTARRLHLPRVIGVGVVKLSKAGVKAFRVRLTRRARKNVRGMRSLRLTARMRATRGSAKTPLRSLRVTLKR